MELENWTTNMENQLQEEKRTDSTCLLLLSRSLMSFKVDLHNKCIFMSKMLQKIKLEDLQTHDSLETPHLLSRST